MTKNIPMNIHIDFNAFIAYFPYFRGSVEAGRWSEGEPIYFERKRCDFRKLETVNCGYKCDFSELKANIA